MDVENGYSDDASDVAALLVALASAGVARVNMEDSVGGAVRPVDEAANVIRVTRQALDGAGLDLFVNARADTYLLGMGEPVDQVVARATAYLDAGADGIFLPGLADLGVIAAARRLLHEGECAGDGR